MKKAAVNGFGRIGKHAVRRLLTHYWDTVDVVAINAPFMDSSTVSYILRFDSVYGELTQFQITYQDDILTILHKGNGETRRIKLFFTTEAHQLPWKQLDIDILYECSGVYKERSLALQHQAAGAKKIILSSPVKDDTIPTCVLGANVQKTDSLPDLISNASCTTNCAAVVLAAVQSLYEIQFVSGSTVHSYTQSQSLLDKENLKGIREGRAAALNIIPTTTGAATNIEKVFPHLAHKIDMVAYRVPTPSGSVVTLDITTRTQPDRETLLATLTHKMHTDLAGIIEVSHEPLVSSDIIGNPHSAIVDAEFIQISENHMRIVAWYDNEYGYTARLVEVGLLM